MTGGAFGPPLGFKSQKSPGWLALNCTKNVPGNKNIMMLWRKLEKITCLVQVWSMEYQKMNLIII